MEHTYILAFSGVEPTVDVDALQGAFLGQGMDVIILDGRLNQGVLALDVSTYDQPALPGLLDAIVLARRLLKGAQLNEVAPDLVDRKELSIRTDIAAPNLQRYINEPWFPNPVANGRCYRLDEAVIALRNNTRIAIDDADSLIETARAARLVNSVLADLLLKEQDSAMEQHQQEAMLALAG